MRGRKQKTRKERRKTKKRKRERSKKRQGIQTKTNRKLSRRKEVKRSYPQYVRGVPRRPGRTVEKALQKVYGVGRNKAKEICQACGRRPKVMAGNLESRHAQRMEKWMIDKVFCSAERRRMEFESIQRHLKLGTVRGMNLRRGLPVRGQRTSTNGRTARRLNKQRGKKLVG
jgi:small subunit ribosomal protein S13